MAGASRHFQKVPFVETRLDEVFMFYGHRSYDNRSPWWVMLKKRALRVNLIHARH